MFNKMEDFHENLVEHCVIWGHYTLQVFSTLS